jgi:hypothetical protein
MLLVYWEAIVFANMLLLIVNEDVVVTKTKKMFRAGGNQRDAFSTFMMMLSFHTRMPNLPRRSALEAHAASIFSQ